MLRRYRNKTSYATRINVGTGDIKLNSSNDNVILSYTNKLYYRAHMWKIKLLVPENRKPLSLLPNTYNRNKSNTLAPIKYWVKDKCKNNYKELTSWRQTKQLTKSKLGKNKYTIVNVCHYTIFVDNEDDYLRIVTKYHNFVNQLSSPINDFYAQIIKDGTNILVRKRLYFNNYRYKINFIVNRYVTSRTVNRVKIEKITYAALMDTVRNSLHDDTKHELEQNYKIQNKSVYLKNQNDYVLMRLTLGDYIKEVTFTVLKDDLVANI